MVVWSGTGNTRHVAERLAASARAQGIIARIAPGASTAEARHPSRRLLGLLGPTHGFTAPWPLLKAALTLPEVRGTDAFVLMTRGGTRVAGRAFPGFEGTAAYLPAGLLALRGARIRGVGAIDMPLNWTVIVPAFSEEAVADIVARGDGQTDAFWAQLQAGGLVFGGRPQFVLGVLILPLSLGYMLVARLVLAKMFFADERCTSCGTCESNCPQRAVRLRGKARRPYWTFDCQNCMRCMSDCPVSAIQGAQAWLLLYAWLISLPVAGTIGMALLGALGISNEWTRRGLTLLLGYVWIVCAVWLAYGALWLGLLVPGLRRVLSRATFTPFYRRYQGPGITRRVGRLGPGRSEGGTNAVCESGSCGRHP